MPILQFHDEELDTVLVAHVVERTDVGMRELRDRPGLPLEPSPHFLVLRQVIRQHFDGDLSPQPRIPRPVDLTHPTRAERGKNLVGAKTEAGAQSHPNPESLRLLSELNS